MTTRRDFLKQAPALVAVGALAPRFWLQAAEQSSGANGRVLVIVQLSGGNDGLNTIVPYGEEAYEKARPKLAVPASDVAKIGQELGFHPALRGFSQLLEQGRLSIVQGVGYPNPNRSHFESMDIWHTCQRKGEGRGGGWLGRYLEHQGSPSEGDLPAVHLGSEPQPLALASRSVRTPSIQSLEQFKLRGVDSIAELTGAVNTPRPQSTDLLSFVQSSTASAISVSERLDPRRLSPSARNGYPATELGEKLKTVASLILSGLSSRVYYVQLDGFDTHAQQLAVHAALLKQLGDAVQAFFTDLNRESEDSRVALLCFSEFGRRLSENASEGTDHGAAAPVFLAGTSVKAGLIGKHPSLSDLDQGDLKHHTDFRQVYATVLRNWLSCPEHVTAEILGGQYAPVDLLPG